MGRLGVSIVIVNFNTREYIFKLLDSIRFFIKYEPLEVIVVDNFSTDGSREELERYKWIRYIKENSNIDHGPALHRGILESKHQYILSLDADTLIIKEGLIERLLGAIHDDNTFAAGKLVLYNSYGMDIRNPKSLTDYLRPSVSLINKQIIEYVHPFCSLINKQIYMERIKSNFFAHGAPGLAVYYEIHTHNKRNQEKIKLINIEGIDKYIHHYGRGSWGKEGAHFGTKKRYHRLARKIKGAPLLADADYPFKAGLLEIFKKIGIDDLARKVIFGNKK